MKKILFVIPSFEVGGTVASLSALIVALEQKYQIDVCALSHDNIVKLSILSNVLPRNFWTHSYSCNLSYARGFAKIGIFLVKVLKRICIKLGVDLERRIYGSYARTLRDKYDLVVGFQEGNATLFTSLVSSPHKIAWVHCDYTNYPKCGQELEIYDKYDDIICVSKYTADRFKYVYPSLSERVSYIYNLMDIERIKLGSLVKIDDPVFRTDKFILISIGRLHSVKRFECIPQIAKKLVENNCEFRWYILGPHFSDSIYNELMDSITDNALSEYVFYLGNKSNPYPYLAQSNLLVSLSTTEACPMIFNEAKALGVPILTTDFGSAFEFIDNGKNGIIVPFEKITSTLENLINSPAKVEALKGANDLVDFNKVIIDSVDQLFM